MESGATGPLQKRDTCIFPCSRILNPREPLLAAMEPIEEADGISERALFVIDKDGVIAWSYLSPIAVNPGADGILEALEGLTKPEKIHG